MTAKDDSGEKQAIHPRLAGAMVSAYKRMNRHLMVVVDDTGAGTLVQYNDGVWGEVTSLETEIGQCCEDAGITATKRLRSEVESYIRTSIPDIVKRGIEWDAHGLIPCANGLLDPDTMDLQPYTPAHYATRKGGIMYEPGAQSPLFDALMQSFFSDREAEEAAELVAIMQEFFGASLAVPLLQREGRKAMILAGPSRTGKTVLADIFRRFAGGKSAGISVSELSGRFGLASLYGANSWVRDDAINEGDALDPQKFKVVVTGETAEIDRKGRDTILHRFNIPVLLTTNSLPEARDGSDAIFNRSLIVRFDHVVTEEEAVAFRRRVKLPKNKSLAEFIVETEGPGILNWALLGFCRLYERGHYVIPESVANAIRGFKDKNNPVGEWSRSAIEYDADYKVHRKDILCSFHGWQKEMQGDAARAMGGHKFIPLLRELFPKISDTNTGGEGRFFIGVRLKPDGLEWWRQHNQDALRGGATGHSTTPEAVNRSVAKWS